MAPKKQIHINFFETACTGSHMAIGQWKGANDNSSLKDSLEYYVWLAKLAEKGKITSIFFADTYAVMDTYAGRGDASFRGGYAVAQLDPVVFVSAMAQVSKTVSFGITGSTSYITPYILARTWSTLDHATKGRVAWNVVTSYSDSAAKAMGSTEAIPHDERYVQANEYMDLMYSLWEGSWEDGAKTMTAEKGAYDPTKIHKIHFDGIYYQMSGYAQAHPSPQRTPVLFQAGSSSSGKQFAGKHAEAIFCGGTNMKKLGEFVAEVRAIAIENGRLATDVNFFPMICPILGRTLEEAQAKHDKWLPNVDWEGGLATISSFMNVDFSKFPPNEPFDLDSLENRSSAIHALINSVRSLGEDDPDKKWTPKMLGHAFAWGGFGQPYVGTPDMIADVFETFINEADIDGFNVSYVSNPESYEDLVELLVPILQERGIMWKNYAVPGGTFRENLRREAGTKTLPSNHPGAQFRYDVLKAGADELGDITISRKPKESIIEGVKNLEVSETVEAEAAKA